MSDLEVSRLLTELAERGISVYRDGSRLRYTAKKGAATPQTLAKIRQNRDALLEMLDGLQTDADPRERIAPLSGGGPSPLSFAQQSLWLSAQLQGEIDPYAMVFAYQLTGDLHVEALCRSVREIHARHDVLRTRFVEMDGVVRQVVDRDARLDVRIVDAVSDEQVREICGAESRRRFDLASDELFCVTLLRRSASAHVLVITTHHILCDGWSMGVFFRELETLYGAFRHGEPTPLPPLEIQYADFACWQRDRLSRFDAEQRLDGWKRRLAGLPMLLELPTDRPPPVVQSHRGAMETLTLPVTVARGLTELSQRRGATLFMVLLSAFKVLLWRYSGQSDIVVGTPVAGRLRESLETMIGFFVNSLVIRSEVSGSRSFIELLASVKETVLDALDNQQVPFERLVEELRPKRSLGHSPLFQVAFVQQNPRAEPDSIEGVTIVPLPPQDVKVVYDLAAYVVPARSGFTCEFRYSTDLFDARTIRQMLGHYVALLGEIVRTPDLHLERFRLLRPEEEQRQLVEWNATEASYPGRSAIHELFEAQVERTPDAVAVVSEELQLSYRELDGRANRVARYLRAQGVGAHSRVGLCAQRSAQSIVGMLGILKSGAAYVPLDAQYPAERIEYLLQDARIEVVLTQQELLQEQPFAGLKVFLLDEPLQQLQLQGFGTDRVAGQGFHPEQLAYVIYTSGTTGKPKGVLVSHRAVVSLVFDEQYLTLQQTDVVGQAATLTFDAATFEVWGCLLHGARLEQLDAGTMHSVVQFEQRLRTRQVSVLFVTTALFNQLVQQGEEVFAHLRYVLFGGEAVDAQTVRGLLGRGAPEHLLHVYGPTETTTFATWHPVREVPADARTVPIGRPMRNMQAYVLQADLRALPQGVHGELMLGGAGLAHGYLNSPALTAQKFVPNPYGGAGERLYRSGDLVRYGDDGAIEFIGRRDSQVKIRGYRVELAEVEAALLSHAQVREAVVVAREERGSKQLIAYLVAPGSEAAALREQLKRHMAEQLPSYMAPAAYLLLDQLPLNANGKVDRKRLPQVQLEEVGRADRYVPARSSVEEALTMIWEQVLGVERVGVEDNFFDLGGDSILSLQLCSRARAVGLACTVQDIFRHQTVAQLARHIGSGGEAAELHSTEPFELISAEERAGLSDQIEDAYPLSALQAGMYYHSELEQQHSAIYHDAFTFHVRGPFVEKAFRAALQGLVDRHPMLRTGFEWGRGNRLLQVVHRSVPLPLQIEDLRHLDAAEQQRHIQSWYEQQKQRPFVWQEAPLLRVHVHLRDEHSYQYNLNLHHSIMDGWSLATLQTELFGHYESLLAQQERVPAAPQVSFRDFIHLEAQALGSQDSRAYWSKALEDLELLQLPSMPAACAPSAQPDMVTVRLQLDEGLLAGLKREARLAGVPLKAVILAAHMKVLGTLSGQRDVVAGLLFNGRLEQQDGERAIGLHLNSLPLRVQLDTRCWRELIVEIFRLEQQMMPHRRFPLPEIQRLKEGKRLLNTLFNYAHFHVYRQLEHSGGFDLIDVTGYEHTEFALATIFVLEVDGTRAHLNLDSHESNFGRPQLQRILSYYERALHSIVEQPTSSYAEVSLLSEAEKQRQLVEWNATEASYPGRSAIHELFEAQVERTPDAVAVVDGEVHVSYGELDARANQVAGYLRDQGVGLAERVGLCLERGAAMQAGMLGILKSGAAYVPLDAQQPAERLNYLLEDAGVRLVVTHSEHVSEGVFGERAVLPLDGKWHEALLGGHGRDAPRRQRFCAEQPAYVMYTSGTTGKPKGVLVSHRAVVRLIEAAVFVQLDAEQVMLQHSAIGFDASTLELYGSLLRGGRAVVASTGIEPQAMQDLLTDERVTVGWFTAGLFHRYVEDRPEVFARMGQVLAGGDVLQAQAVRALQRRYPKLIVINGYGPTENTTFTCCHRMSEELEGGTVPIGRPIQNTKAYILDARQELLPAGAVGELYAQGAGLAHGYLNSPALTAQKFVPNPYGGAGERLYRSGDLVRYGDDGAIEFIGRRDSQVKIRGYRVELAEVEAALLSHAQVREAVVVAREERGSKQLIAYLVAPGSEAAALREQLKRHMAEQLPSYMAPAAYLLLDQLPLNANGKVDRKRLPQVQLEEVGRADRYVPARSSVEEALTMIWEQVLGVERVGVEDNFFDLGGDSILSLQLCSRARAVGLACTVQDIFRHQTVAQLARHIGSGGEAAELHSTEPFELISAEERAGLSDQIEDAYPLSALQAGMYYHSELEQQHSAIYHDAFTFHVRGPFVEKAFRAALQGLVDRHPMLRTGFEWGRGNRLLQVVHRSVPLPLQIEDLRHLDAAEQQRHIQSWYEQQKQRPFVWQEAPLLRVHVHLRDEHSYQYNLNLHHSIMDGWSLATLQTELFGHYESLLAGRPLQLQAPRSHYRNFVREEQRVADSEDSRQYWREQLRGSSMLALPVGNPSAAVCSDTLLVEESLLRQLRVTARAAAVPLKSLVLAAHAHVLATLSGQQDIVTGLLFNGRLDETDGERVLGLFLNSLPLRVRMGVGTWRDLMREVFEAEQHMLAHRRYPLAQIQREHGGAALFQTLLNYTHFHVYEDLKSRRALQIQAAQMYEESNFTLVVNFSIAPHGDHAVLKLDSAGGAFTAQQRQELLGYYDLALRAIGAGAHHPYRHVPLLSAQQLRQQCEQWNDTACDFARERCVHELFEEQVARTPDAVAAATDANRWSYARLNECANRIARFLIARDVGAGDRVGIYRDRSPLTLAAILGTLKAGAAYVPLDSTYPTARVSWIAKDARVKCVLTEGSLGASLDAPDVCSLEEHWSSIDSLSGSNPRVSVSSVLPAFIFYTSGSTGTPKGVLGTHRSVGNRLSWMWRQYPFSDGEVMSHKTSLGFADSVWEMFGGLLRGVRTEIIPVARALDAQDLLDTLQRAAVTRVVLVPSLLGAMLEMAPAFGARLPALKYLSCSGERLPVQLARQLRESAPLCRLFNLYGSSEVMADVTFHEASDVVRSESVPIGRPIANTRVYVLNPAMMLAPVGVTGELHAGGENLALGYFGQPRLTAQKFVPNPYGGAGERLYRSGDLVRYGDDGAIEFIGRRDSQVKIRGYRVELAEVEAALLSHAQVREAVVVAREERGSKQLIAYLVAPGSEAAALREQLKRHMAEQLPSYMAPAAYLLLDQLPLNANGKVDRKRLPDAELLAQRQESYRPPRTARERTLVTVWESALGVSPIGIADNFFEIGGDSIVNIQVVARARQAGLHFGPRELFEHPTIEALALVAREGSDEQEHALSPSEQPALQVTEEEMADVGTRLGRLGPAIREAGAAAIYPLSPLQRGMLFHSELDSQSGEYVVQVLLRLENPDAAALRAAWESVIGRHDILRTLFVRMDTSRPLQVVLHRCPLDWIKEDWRDLDDLQQRDRTNALLSADRQRGFAFADAPPLRFRFMRLRDETFQLLWSFHHALSDGWSTAILLQEVEAAYAAQMRNEVWQPAVMRPYGDFIAWLLAEDSSQALEYWRTCLRGFSSPTLLRPVLAPSRVSGERGFPATFALTLPDELSVRFRDFVKRERLTAGVVLQGLWALLLSRYTGETDVVFGAVVSGRPPALRGVENMVGPFINTVPVRAQVRGDATARKWLVEFHALQTEREAHAHTALQEILQCSDVPADIPLFDSLFVFRNYPVEKTAGVLAGSGGALGVREIRAIDQTNYPLVFQPSLAGALEIDVQYDPGTFDAADIERLADRYRVMLEAVLEEPATRLSDVSMLTPGEATQLEDWNATDVEYPQDAFVHRSIERMARLAPDRTALAFDSDVLSYSELDARAGRLAHELVARGAGPGQCVGVSLQRGFDYAVSLLGVLKTGAAYVPLEPDQPAERIAYMAQDASVRFVIDADCEWREGSRGPTLENGDGVCGDSPAYVMYTSGSTGMPKGSVNTHDGIRNQLQWIQDAYPLDADDRMLLKTSCSFDVSVWELFWPLVAGATLVIARPGGHRDPDYLADLMESARVTDVQFVPSMLNAFLADRGLAGYEPKRVYVGGETLPSELQQQFHRQYRTAQLCNMYGPTEAAVHVTAWNCLRGAAPESVPIGKPVSNTRLHIVDAGGQLQAVGIRGRLYIGGVGLAQCYLRRPRLTADKFVPDPFSGMSGARLYDTGDLARYQRDGTIEFHGRRDFQVKIRGIRVELGEIEATIARHDAVRNVVVVARGGRTGTTSLVAYVVRAGGSSASWSDDALIKALRGAIAATLPAYMMPATFVFMDALPLTSSGKIDRLALPAPAAMPEAVQAYVPARTPLEASLVSIWEAVLGHTPIGIHENFFASGGDSILNLQVVTRARQAGLGLSARHVFEHQTIAELAQVVQTNPQAAGQQGAISGRVAALPIQRWFFEQQLEDSHHFNQAMVLECAGGVDPQILSKSLVGLCAHHDALRLRFERTAAGWEQVQRAADVGDFLQVLDVSDLPESRQEAEIAAAFEKAQCSFDLAAGGLFAAVCVKGVNKAGRRVDLVLLAIHHLVVDGVSWRILLEDLDLSYEQLKTGARLCMPFKSASYQAWSDALQTYAGEALGAEFEYWEQFHRGRDVALPLDRHVSASEAARLNTVQASAYVRASLSTLETTQLLRDAPIAHRTEINDLLLTAFALMLGDWLGRRDVLFELEGHGREEIREDIDMSRTVGWFTSLFPVRLRISDRASMAGCINEIKAQLRAIPLRGLGYGVLRYLTPEGSARLGGAAPIPISFNYLGRFGQDSAARRARFATVDYPMGPTVSRRQLRSHVLAFGASVENDQLIVSCQFCAALHERQSVERLLSQFLEHLRSVIRHCRDTGPGDFTSADFPDADLEQEEFDVLLKSLPVAG